MWHMVYTPVKGMTSGGHFLTYDTMHMTEMIREYDSSKPSRGKKASNAVHDINRQVIRMTLALPALVWTRSEQNGFITRYH
jgi:hypothetical protein